MNLNKIRNALKEIGKATKPQLAEKTGLSVVTVNSLVNTLIEQREIIPDVTLDSEGGRPAASFRFNSNFRLVLVIYMHEYLGKDTAFYCVVNLRGEVIERCEQKLNNACMEDFDPVIEEYLSKFPNINAICFGIPGAEVNQKIIVTAYENIREQSITGHITDKFHLPVIVENDINAAVLGYCFQNNIADDQCVIGLYFPDKYPPGAGLYLNGNIYKGTGNLAGEIKYLPLGIDWETFDFNLNDAVNIIVKTIQIFMCTLNPDKIILYGENDGHTIQKLFYEKAISEVEKIMIPEIVISSELNADFEYGIKQIALKMINV
ncbi:MAG: ROK family protein [Mobilitalea sp.]